MSQVLTDDSVRDPRHRLPSYQPMVLVVVALAIGVFLDRVFNIDWRFSLAFSAVNWLGWVGCRRIWIRGQARALSSGRERFTSTILLIGLVFAGAFWHHGQWNWFGTNEIGLFAGDVSIPCCIDASVISEPRWMAASESEPDNSMDDTARTRLTLRIKGIRDGKQWRRCTGIADLVIHTSTDHVKSGDHVRVFGRLVAGTPPSNPGQFDFQKYYRAKRKLAFLHAYENESVQVIESASWSGVRLISKLRHRLNEITWKYVDSKEAGFASAIMLGNREQLSKSRRESFLETGTIHLLAISGLHVGILASTFFMFYRLGLLGRRKCLWATIIFVIFYAWLVEFRPPVSRAAILVTLFCIGRLLGETNFSFNLLAIAGLIVLLINPSDLFGLGPQLSFLAVATLTFGRDWVFWPPPKDPIKRLIASTRPGHVRVLHWFGRQLRTAMLVSGLIWIVAMPLVAYRFHLVAPIALLINPLLLIPIAWGLYGALGVLVFGWFLAPAAKVCGWFCERNLSLIEWMIGGAQSIPGSHFWTSGPSVWSLVVFYAGMFLFAVFPPSRLPGRWIAALAFVWLVFGWLVPDQTTKFFDRQIERPLICTFVDVGHGSGVLIQLPNGRNVLYDAGSFGAAEYGARSIAGVLWSERIEHLDAIVLSHADVDHFNAVPQLTEQFSIGVVYVSRQMLESDSSAVHQLFESLADHGVPVRQVSAGDRLLSGRETSLEVLGPSPEGFGGNDNSNSIVLLLEYNGSKVLLPGDLELEGLSRLLDSRPIDCDLVMAPHHGSKHSQPSEFMRWSTPEYVVISGGSQRVSDATVEQFEPHVRTVARTDVDGAIQFVVDHHGSRLERWKTQPWR